MSKNLNDLLNDETKGKTESRSLLTTLFRQILEDLAILPTHWYEQCNKYFRSPISSVGKNTRDISQARNNLSRVISQDVITWRTFIRAVSILGPKSIKLTCELDWGNDRVTRHTAQMGNDVYIANRMNELREARDAELLMEEEDDVADQE